MRPVRLLGPALLVGGAACLAVGYVRGEATLSLFVVFPVITATGGWSAAGILLLIAGLFVSVLSWSTAGTSVAIPPPATGAAVSSSVPLTSPPTRRWGGVVFLGPVPVVFGSDMKVARWMILVGLLVFVGLLVLTVISIWGI